ncbi:hypothetical protein [Streptomyces caelestis]
MLSHAASGLHAEPAERGTAEYARARAEAARFLDGPAPPVPAR